MGEKVFLLASLCIFRCPQPACLAGAKVCLEPRWKRRQNNPALELGFMLDKPAWDRKKRSIRSNYKTSQLPDKPAAGVEMWVILKASALGSRSITILAPKARHIQARCVAHYGAKNRSGVLPRAHAGSRPGLLYAATSWLAVRFRSPVSERNTTLASHSTLPAMAAGSHHYRA
jgi:hypothetical protein